jgi:transposase
MEITTIGLDLAKNFFQIHGIDAAGGVIVRKALRRSQMLPFFRGLALAWWGWRRAGHRIIGRAS